MGGGSSKKGGGKNKAADAQARIAQHLVEQTDPLRASLVDRSSAFLGGDGMGMVTNTPAFAEFKRATGDQFSQARENAMSRLPAGGALVDALAGIEGDQASTLSQGAGAMFEGELSRAMQMATGGAAQGMSGLGQAAATQAQMAANRASVTGSKYEGLGAGAGAYMGMK